MNACRPIGRLRQLALESRAELGWTLIELLLAVSIMATLMALAVPRLGDARENRRVLQAVSDIRTIESEVVGYALVNRRPPPSLAEIGWARILDPWGSPYRYLRFDGVDWLLRARVDRFDIPINSTYDLYSMGRDGRSALSLQLPASWDDVIRANDGAYVGRASSF